MDENFLLHRKRALRLLELMEAHDKAWSLQVFSSAKVIRSYTIDQLISLGLSWVWMGLEGKNSGYSKLDGVDTFELVRQLQSHGVRVLGSTIIGLEHHTPENIEGVIDYAVRHDADFHQFMLYSPSPGTPFYHELADRGRLKDEEEFPWADWHGQLAFSWRHPHIKDGQETEFIVRAFSRDFEVNGPSVLRAMRTMLSGWKRYKDHPEPRIRRRFTREVKSLRKTGRRRGRRHQGVLPRQSAASRQDVEAAGRRVRPVWGPSPPDRRGGGPLRAGSNPCRGKEASRGLDLRATHLLRPQRCLPTPFRRGSSPGRSLSVRDLRHRRTC